MNMMLRFGLLIGVAALGSQVSVTAQVFHGIGDLPGGEALSEAKRVSANGTVIVGISQGASGAEAFRWSLSDGLVGLGDLQGGSFSSIAYDVSADGSAVVGSSNIGGVFTEAFRWTQAGGMVRLGNLPGGFFSRAAFGVSDDGEVIVGSASGSGFGTQAFRWRSASGMTLLGALGFRLPSVATGVSGDGAVVVGWSGSAGGIEAFRWTETGRMVGLGDLTGGAFYSVASDVSKNGAVVVGTSESTGGREAFRWEQASGMIGLGDLQGGDFSSSASAVSADGAVVVGTSESADGSEAFRWTQLQGMHSVRSLLIASGVDLGTWSLEEAAGVSADGLVVVGTGMSPNGNVEAWWAKIGTGFLAAGPLRMSLQSLALPPLMAQQDATSELNKALDASRQSACKGASTKTERLCVWMSLGARGYNDKQTTTDGVVGLGHSVTPALRVGGGLSWGWRDIDLGAFGGGARSESWSGNLFVAYEPGTHGVRVHAAAIADRFNTEVSRGYLNGVIPEISRGGQDGWAYGAALTAGWAFPVFDAVSLTPFVGYEVSTLDLAPYTEIGGAFPATINGIDDTLEIVRLGAELESDVGGDLTLWVRGGVAHRFDEQAPEVSGQIMAIASAFTFPGAEVSKDWAEATIGARRKLGDRSEFRAELAASSDGDTVPGLRIGIGGSLRF